MPRLSKAHAHALSAVRSIATRPLAPDQLASELLVPLERAIGWDGYRFFGVDVHTRLINRLLSASDNDRNARREWLETVYLDERALPYLQISELFRVRLRAGAYQPRQEQSWGYPNAMLQVVDPGHHSRYYVESQSPIGGTLHATFESGGRGVAVLQAYRRDVNCPFHPKDVALMQAASPMIGRALGMALAGEESRPRTNAYEASGIVFVAKDRSIAHVTPAGSAWIEQLRMADGGGADTLPTAVWSAVKGLEERNLPALQMAAMTPLGPVTLDVSDGGDGSIAIVILPNEPQPKLDPPGHWGLTSQQNQIAMLVIRGASNRDIAERLFLSENTVEWHLRQVYRTLDLSSRTQLQARFFREVGLSRYHEPASTTE